MVETHAGQGLNARDGVARWPLAVAPAATAGTAARLAACLLAALLFAGCASFPVEEVPPPDARQPETGTGPRLPPELPPAPPEAVPTPQPAPQPLPAPVPTPIEPRSYHPAGEALVEQARRESDLGNDALAGATLERALRIDGNNPWIWIELGYLRLDAGQRAAAESMARKALSLANRDPVARDAATRLLQQAGAPP
jgi:tetratricopeptide (TPR) repeat protein